MNDQYTREEFNKMQDTLTKMGIRFESIGQPQEATLPPLPSSSPQDLQRNTYSGFYKVGSRDFWKDAELGHTQIEDFQKCKKHNFVMRPGDKVMCTQCHMGWIVPQSFSIRNGDLYDGDTLMQFA